MPGVGGFQLVVGAMLGSAGGSPDAWGDRPALRPRNDVFAVDGIHYIRGVLSPAAATLAALGAALLALVALLIALRRRPVGSDPAALAGVHERLDRLLEGQQAIPRTLAEGAADVRERLARLSEATRRLETLGAAVADVQQLLQVPRLRGTLGELWLEELLRQVLPAGSWELQYGFRSGERVDAVIRLRERLVPVDAKFPLEACRRLFLLEGEDEARERRALQRTLRQRVDEIAEKYIRPEEGTYDFALMYVPAEAVYYEAVVRGTDDAEESVTAYAHRRRVVIVSPNTFYAYLASLAHGLRGLEVEARAREIVDGLSALELELDRTVETVALAGRHLQNAVKQQEEAERRLGVLGGRLAGLRAGSAGAGAPPETP